MADRTLVGRLALTCADLISVGEAYSGSGITVVVEGEVVPGDVCCSASFAEECCAMTGPEMATNAASKQNRVVRVTSSPRYDDDNSIASLAKECQFTNYCQLVQMPVVV